MASKRTQERIETLSQAYLEEARREREAKDRKEAIRLELLRLVPEVADKRGCSYTLTTSQASVQVQEIPGKPFVDEQQAEELVRNCYPKLVPSIFVAFSLDAFTEAVLHKWIKKQDLEAVMRVKDPVVKLVVKERGHDGIEKLDAAASAEAGEAGLVGAQPDRDQSQTP